MRGGLAGLAAAASLALSGIPAPSGAAVIWVSVCHGAPVPLNLPARPGDGPGKSCPAGCHAACLQRRSDIDSGGDEDDV